MSKKLDLSDLSKLSADDLNYALQRYMITEEEFISAGGSVASDEDESSEMSAGDDPSNFKVAQVKAYLETADDDEFARVISAEKKGEARKGILDLAN